MIQKIKKDKKFTTWFLLNFALSFMLCIFAPLDAYYGNMHDFWFTIPQMLPVCIIAFLILMVVLNLAAWFLRRTKAADFLLAGGFALFFYLYIQGNFIPRSYGFLDGEEIDWGAYPGYAAASIILGIVCLTLFALLITKLRKQLNTVVKLGSAFVVCMLAGTIAILMIQNGIPIKQDDTIIVTDKDLYTVSSDRNIIVFVLDTYDSENLNILLQNEYENTAAIYENFTYYRDTLGVYNLTEVAMPRILTGQWYQNEEPYNDYIKRASSESTLYQDLNENGFSSTIYTNHPEFISTDMTYLENIYKGEYRISNQEKFAKKIFKLVAFYYAPHQLKQSFFIDTGEFTKLRTSKEPVYDWTTPVFADGLKAKGELSVSKTGNLFKVIHLQGCHSPHTYGKEMVIDGGEYTVFEQAQGSNKVMKEYFDALKAAGVYDQSTIIVMADHGDYPLKQNPLFMIKNANEKHPFASSDAKMSYEYLPKVWKALVAGETVEEADIQSYLPDNGQRRFLWLTSDRVKDRNRADYYTSTMQEMICDGHAYDLDSLTSTGVYYLPKRSDYDYELGDRLEFNQTNNTTGDAYLYFVYGTGRALNRGMNLSSNGLMRLDIKEPFERLYVKIFLSKESAEWHSNIQANGHVIDEVYQSKDKRSIYFDIPAEYVTDGRLELHFYQSDTADKTDMAASFVDTEIILKYITISAISNDETIENIMAGYKLGDELGFNSDDNTGINYLQSGNLADPVEEGMEFIGSEATIQMIPLFTEEKEAGDLLAHLKYHGPEESIRVLFYANDTLLKEQYARGTESLPLQIPLDLLNSNNGKLTMRIELPDKTEEGPSGFYLKGLTIDKDEQ